MGTYILINGQQIGPYTDAQILHMLACGQVSADTIAWREGMTEWQPLRSLFPASFPPPPPARNTPPVPKPIAPRPQPSSGAKNLSIKSFVLPTLLVVVSALYLFRDRSLDSVASFTDKVADAVTGRSAARIYELSGDEALVEARKFMVGTWTYTGPNWKFLGEAMWIKWVINADRTVKRYSAPATANGWGEPDVEKWDIRTDKYSDTGRRYYAFRIGNNQTQAIIREDGIVVYSTPDGPLVMERGEKFPFSK